jgi:hypothetical protein
MQFVLDASVAVAWAFADEEHPVAAAALALIRNGEGCVPSRGGLKYATYLSSMNAGVG